MGKKKDDQPEEVQQETANAQPEEVQPETAAHICVFRRGILPGQKYIRNCIIPSCGVTEEITYSEWIRTL